MYSLQPALHLRIFHVCLILFCVLPFSGLKKQKIMNYEKSEVICTESIVYDVNMTNTNEGRGRNLVLHLL